MSPGSPAPHWNLIIHADDLGMNSRRDDGILALAATGAISSASLVVTAAGSRSAAERAMACGLPLGLHLNLSEGHPLAVRGRLTDASGELPGKQGLAGRIAKVPAAELRLEIRAQIDRFADLTGRLPTHVDGHHHAHVLPEVAAVLAPLLTEAYGIHRIRLPLENFAVAAPAGDFYAAVRSNAAAAAPVFAAHGLLAPDAFLGIGLMGAALSAETAARGLEAIRQSWAGSGKRRVFVELMCHPGIPSATGSDFDRSPARGHELAVLASEAMRRSTAGFARVSFADLERPEPDSGRRRFLIVSKLVPGTGNQASALRLRDLLAARGEVVLHRLPDGLPGDEAATHREIDALRRLASRERIDFAIGIQAYRAGTLLAAAFAGEPGDPTAARLPFALVISGTDANHDLLLADRREAIGQALAAAEFSIALGPGLADRIAETFPRSRRPSVATLTPKLDPASGHPLRAELALPGAAKIILLPAALRPVKGILRAIDHCAPVLAAHADHVLLVIGPPLDPAYAERCRMAVAAIEPASVRERILFHPGLPRPEYLALLADAAALINTSDSEGRSNAILEAMALGVPVLARDIPGNRELLRHGETGLLFGDPTDFAAACERLIVDDAFRRTLVAAARHTVPASDRLAEDACWLAAVDAALDRRYRRFDFPATALAAESESLEFLTGGACHPPSPDNLRLFLAAWPGPELCERLRRGHATGLDLGCGSGLFGVAVAKRLVASGIPPARWCFADNDADCLGSLRRNLERWHDRAGIAAAETCLGDLYAALPVGRRFDLVVANPPQTPGPRPFANDRCGGGDGADMLCRLIDGLPSRLADDGECFLLQIGLANPRRVAGAIAAAGLVAEPLAAERRIVALADYDALDPAIRPELARLRRLGVSEWSPATSADGGDAIAFAVRLLRLRRTGGRRHRPDQPTVTMSS